MRTEVSMHVRFRGKERLLRLTHAPRVWHARFVVTGKVDILTDRFVESAPPGTQLPTVELLDFALRIEVPKDHVVSLGMGKLLSMRGVAARDGWIPINLTSVMGHYHDDIGLRHLRDAARRLCTILDFRDSARNGRQKADREMER